MWNQDDTFCIKDGTSNVLVERVNASGMGLTIGSISSNIKNITFRDVHMHHTKKGIYMKQVGRANANAAATAALLPPLPSLPPPPPPPAVSAC